ncbi:hypothetical protein [Stenoxybacter acetivorans]|uniref:hypothetical protein n=1 Tax=Stenoxybacter acetivorans TaxID=422441 RepID=UPI00056C4135|nr:hypothetical protein [Stenoxybacter acetivorans]
MKNANIHLVLIAAIQIFIITFILLLDSKYFYYFYWITEYVPKIFLIYSDQFPIKAKLVGSFFYFSIIPVFIANLSVIFLFTSRKKTLFKLIKVFKNLPKIKFSLYSFFLFFMFFNYINKASTDIDVWTSNILIFWLISNLLQIVFGLYLIFVFFFILSFFSSMINFYFKG